MLVGFRKAQEWQRRDVAKFAGQPGVCYAWLRTQNAHGADDVKVVAVNAPADSSASAMQWQQRAEAQHGPCAMLSRGSQRILANILIRDIERRLLTRVFAWAV